MRIACALAPRARPSRRLGEAPARDGHLRAALLREALARAAAPCVPRALVAAFYMAAEWTVVLDVRVLAVDTC